MSFDHCLSLLQMQEKIPVDDIREAADQYKAEGMDPAAAMTRAVEEHLDQARRDQAKLIAHVRQQFVEAGGKLPEPAEPVLTSYSRDDIVQRQDAAQAAAKDEQAARAAQDRQRRQEQDDKDIAARMDASAENFQLGQSAHDSLSGQRDIFMSKAADDLGIQSKLLDHMEAIADERGMVKADRLAAWVREQDAPGAAPLAHWLDVMGNADVAQSSVVKYLEHAGKDLFSRFDPSRRRLLAAAAAAALAPREAGSGVELGRTKAIDAAVLGEAVAPRVDQILRDGRASGETGENGLPLLRHALQEISITGPREVRDLALQTERLLPVDGEMRLTIDDTANAPANGTVELGDLPHMRLYTADGRTGLTYETVLHEAMHVAVAARYHSLARAAEEGHEALGLSAPAAARAIAQLHDVWNEFREAAGGKLVNADLDMSVSEARRSVDEFFVRTLTDPVLQQYMAGKRYEGRTLWGRFKDWVKTNLFGMEKGGVAPSWLDAALAASHDVVDAMRGDPARFDGEGAGRMDSRRAEPDPEEEAAASQQEAEARKGALARLIHTPKSMLQSAAFHVRMLAVPMEAGDVKAMAMAKDFANQNRRASAQWKAFDKVLRTHYTDEQLEKMWTAADQENDLRREGRTSDTLGLASLTAGERKTVELLHAYGQELWRKAQAAGMVEGDGVAFWTPRVAARIAEDGSAESIRSAFGEFSKDAKNLKTSASSLKKRQHKTTEESEAALKTKLGEDAAYVKNIRVMPLAMAQLERAIAGRTLVNQIKAHGKLAGEDLVSTEAGPAFVTFDHPALKQWRPRMDWQPADMGIVASRGYDVRADGVYRDGERLASYRIKDGAVQKLQPLEDGNGKPIMESSPLYIRKDFAGPLKAVFTGEQNAIYRGLMNLKGAVTSVIMLSPLTHNLVIWGKAMPTMISTMGWKNNLKNSFFGIHGYVVGNRARQDHALMNELVEAGLVPVSGRGMTEDAAAIANGIEPGRSLTAKAIGAVFDVASPKAGDAARRAVDAAGEFWHEKLLWDRVADLQAGMAVMMRTSLMDKGVDQYTANRIATHFANRYAGMIPHEAMSEGAHMLLNLSLFSKSFTMTNLGAYKDVLAGLPKDVRAQIQTRTFEMQRALGKNEDEANQAAGRALSEAQKIARKKALAVLVLDIGAMTTAASLAQALWQGQTGQQIADDLKERLAKLGLHFKDDPLAVLIHPLDSLGSLSQTADNPHGKEDRVRVGEDEQGNSYYMRLPVGKVGEEIKQYGNLVTGMHLAHNKMSTFMRPIADLTANEDFTGKRIINPDDNIVKQAAAFAAYWVKSQMPMEEMKSAAHLATGTADHMDKLKLLGMATGLSVSKLAGGDEVAEMRYQNREQQAKLRDVLPDAREAVRRGDVDKAQQILEDAGQTPKEAMRILSQIDNPDRISQSQRRKFYQHATDEERERIERMRARAGQ
jgi:hypothetical protein